MVEGLKSITPRPTTDAAAYKFVKGVEDDADLSTHRVDTTTAIRQETYMKYSLLTDEDVRNEICAYSAESTHHGWQ